MTLGDTRSIAVGALASKRFRKQDHRGRPTVQPYIMAIEPAVPITHLPRVFWPSNYQVLSDRGMIQLNAKGNSEFIAHVDWAEQVDSHNVLSKIKWIGLRIPLKCFRAWNSLTRRNKFQRRRQKLAVGALHMRPRAIRVLSRVALILQKAEEAALDGEVTLLPTLEMEEGMKKEAPDSLEFKKVADAHCKTLAVRIQAIVQSLAMAVDEEWSALNWAQEVPPGIETEESAERRIGQLRMEVAPMIHQQRQQQRRKHEQAELDRKLQKSIEEKEDKLSSLGAGGGRQNRFQCVPGVTRQGSVTGSVTGVGGGGGSRPSVSRQDTPLSFAASGIGAARPRTAPGPALLSRQDTPLSFAHGSNEGSIARRAPSVASLAPATAAAAESVVGDEEVAEAVMGPAAAPSASRRTPSPAVAPPPAPSLTSGLLQPIRLVKSSSGQPPQIRAPRHKARAWSWSRALAALKSQLAHRISPLRNLGGARAGAAATAVSEPRAIGLEPSKRQLDAFAWAREQGGQGREGEDGEGCGADRATDEPICRLLRGSDECTRQGPAEGRIPHAAAASRWAYERNGCLEAESPHTSKDQAKRCYWPPRERRREASADLPGQHNVHKHGRSELGQGYSRGASLQVVA